MPALPGPPLWVSTPSLERRRRTAARQRRDDEHGDFRDFHEVGLLGPAAELGGRSPREVAHTPPAYQSQCSWGLPHQSEQSPVEAGEPAGKGATKLHDGKAKATLRNTQHTRSGRSGPSCSSHYCASSWAKEPGFTAQGALSMPPESPWVRRRSSQTYPSTASDCQRPRRLTGGWFPPEK